ncbi:esterase-like activity of phytase family protein [Caulobacter sp. DWR1-3-2b1]|uniref:esterase-like activity of phytase family protein n=1 Tax=Caulobacter sp. DWR1-3-2b1 TaxID=2804670 RepID=UPI003CEFE0B4
MIGLRAALVLALAAGMLGHCSRKPAPPPLPMAPVKVGPEIALQTTPVPLDASNRARTTLEGFVFAGGVAITSPQTSRLHGLSDLTIAPDGGLVAVTDDGDLFQARLVLDPTGRLIGLTDGKLEGLKGPDGQPLQGKDKADAEGVAILANGDRLISFERDHRIWLYPAAGGPPRPASKPATIFPYNEGMEALAAYPAAGPDAYLVGGEEGEVWLCKLSAACQALAPQQGPDFTWGLTAMATFNGPAIATFHRGFDPIRGWRGILRFVANPMAPAGKQVHAASLHLDGSITRDNYEGVALSSTPSGATRIYLISDDGSLPGQRTLLMAFDWTPPPPPPPAPPGKPRKPVRKR